MHACVHSCGTSRTVECHTVSSLRHACAGPQHLYRVARRFYLLFQQHTIDAFNARAQEFLTNDGS